MPEELAEEIHKIASGAGKHDNTAIVKLLELGVTFYHKLPGNMCERIWRPTQKFTQQQRFRQEAEWRAERLIEHSKLNSFIVFRAPEEKKQLLQRKAREEKVTVSNFIRSRVLEEKED